MADAPRTYDPTQRHLRRLREEGRGPHVAIARGVAVLIVTVGASTLLLKWAAHSLAARWVLVLSAAPSAGPASVLVEVRALAAWSAASLVGICLAGVLVLLAVDALWAGLSSRRRSLVSRSLWRPAAARSWRVALLLDTCALALVGAVAWPLLSAAPPDQEALFSLARYGSLAAIAVAVVALLTAADLATSYLFYLADARMSRAELMEERRETQPSESLARRRSSRMHRRRSTRPGA